MAVGQGPIWPWVPSTLGAVSHDQSQAVGMTRLQEKQGEDGFYVAGAYALEGMSLSEAESRS